MIPQVTMRWAQKSCTCKYCNNPIDSGTPEVSVFYRSKEGRTWNAAVLYHPECWLAAGLQFLKDNPFIPEQPEPDRQELTEQQKTQRKGILRKYASLRQRQRKLKVDNPRYPVLYANLEAQIAGLMIELLQLGGIPKKWADG
jgi:hypothetical protein